MLTFKSIPSVFMYAMNIQNDVIGLVLHKNCKSKQMTDIINTQFILISCGKHLVDRIFSLTVDACAHKTSLPFQSIWVHPWF
jgi:hypothetical protein